MYLFTALRLTFLGRDFGTIWMNIWLINRKLVTIIKTIPHYNLGNDREKIIYSPSNNIYQNLKLTWSRKKEVARAFLN